MGTFQSGVMQCENAVTPTPSFGFQTTITNFEMRYCMMFYLKGHQNYKLKNEVLMCVNATEWVELCSLYKITGLESRQCTYKTGSNLKS